MSGKRFGKSVAQAQILLLSICLLIVVSGCASPWVTTSAYRCTDSIGCVTILPGEPLVLGVLQTLRGGSSPGGLEQERTIRLVIEQRSGEILGHPIKLQVEDDRCSAEGGANGALKIVADPRVIAILGTNCSSAAVTAGKVMSEKGLVMISSANTSPALTSVGGKRGANWYPGYFRTAWNDTAMGQAAATFAYQELGLRKAAVVNAGDAYTKGLTDVFVQVFEGLGGHLVLETTVDEEDLNQRPMLDAVTLSGAEFIFFPLSHPDTGVSIVQQAVEIDSLQNLVFIGGESMASEVFLQGVRDVRRSIYVLGPEEPASPANNQLRLEYLEEYGEPPLAFYHSFAYDATHLLLDAIERTAVVEKDGTLHIGREALRSSLYGVKDFKGLTGTLTCDGFGDCGAVRLNVFLLDETVTSISELRQNVVFTYASSSGQ